MPKNFMRYKAGKCFFLLVCLFLCSACGKQEAVFKAGEDNIPDYVQENIVEAAAVEEQKEALTEDTKEDTLGTELININIATVDELMTLPGIGEVRALAIIEYRDSVGTFEQVEDIMNVKGIKTGVFSKINGLICVK